MAERGEETPPPSYAEVVRGSRRPSEELQQVVERYNSRGREGKQGNKQINFLRLLAERRTENEENGVWRTEKKEGVEAEKEKEKKKKDRRRQDQDDELRNRGTVANKTKKTKR